MCDAYSEISGISAYTSEATAGSTTKQHSSCCLKFVNLELLMHNTVNVRERKKAMGKLQHSANVSTENVGANQMARQTHKSVKT